MFQNLSCILVFDCAAGFEYNEYIEYKYSMEAF